MAQAITFRAFGAARLSFDTVSEALGYSLSVRFADEEKTLLGLLLRHTTLLTQRHQIEIGQSVG